MLRIDNLRKNFGGLVVTDGVSLDINPGELHAVIGPNGAGKTTLISQISGTLTPSSGSIFLNGTDITGLPPHDLFHKGLLRTFQIAHEFGSMTVRENLMMVPPRQTGEKLWNALFSRGQVAEEEGRIRAQAHYAVFRTKPGDASEVYNVGRYIDEVVRTPHSESRRPSLTVFSPAAR